MAGISRSATIVIAYIMHDRKVPYKVAYDMVKQLRPVVQPNPSFKRQLEVFERWVLGVQTPPIHHYGLKYVTPSDAAKTEATEASKVIDAQAEGAPSGADAEPSAEPYGNWNTSECEILYRLEWSMREDVGMF